MPLQPSAPALSLLTSLSLRNVPHQELKTRKSHCQSFYSWCSHLLPHCSCSCSPSSFTPQTRMAWHLSLPNSSFGTFHFLTPPFPAHTVASSPHAAYHLMDKMLLWINTIILSPLFNARAIFYISSTEEEIILRDGTILSPAVWTQQCLQVLLLVCLLFHCPESPYQPVSSILRWLQVLLEEKHWSDHPSFWTPIQILTQPQHLSWSPVLPFNLESPTQALSLPVTSPPWPSPAGIPSSSILHFTLSPHF